MIESVHCTLDANIIVHPFDIPHISINIGFAQPPWGARLAHRFGGGVDTQGERVFSVQFARLVEVAS